MMDCSRTDHRYSQSDVAHVITPLAEAFKVLADDRMRIDFIDDYGEPADGKNASSSRENARHPALSSTPLPMLTVPDNSYEVTDDDLLMVDAALLDGRV